MLSHALTIVINELNRHLVAEYGAVAPQAALGNLSEGLAKRAPAALPEICSICRSQR
jgi:hypothetical protein